MITNTEAEQLRLRPARPEDREAVFAMVATVWDGTDYIPRVWDEWLRGEDGPMLVGLLGERPVSLCKLTDLGEREDWFEGVRVDPAFRGRGIAREMTRQAIEISRGRGSRTLRFQTSEENPTMHRLAEEIGFRLVYAPQWFSTTPVGAPPTYRPLAAERLPELLGMVQRSRLLALTGGLYSYRWMAMRLSEARLRRHLAEGQVLGLPGGQAWVIRMPTQVGGHWIAHAEGPNEELVQLFRALRHVAAPFEGETFLRTHMPPAAPVIPVLLEAGFELGDHGARVYEYMLQ